MTITAHAFMYEICFESLLYHPLHQETQSMGYFMDENQTELCVCMYVCATCLPHMTSYYLWRDIVLMLHFAHVKDSICIIHKSLEPSEPFISQAYTCIMW